MPLNAFVAQIRNQITFTFSHFCSYSRGSSRLDVVICFFFLLCRRHLSISHQQITTKLSKTFINKSHMMVHFKLAQILCWCCCCDRDLQQYSKREQTYKLNSKLCCKSKYVHSHPNIFWKWLLFYELDPSFKCVSQKFFVRKLPHKKLCVKNVTQCPLSKSHLAMGMLDNGFKQAIVRHGLQVL